VAKIIGAAFTSVFVLASSSAMAQEASVRQACTSELQQHCAGVQPGDGRIRACVEEHFAEFSESCQRALVSNVAVVKVCKPDVKRTCSGVEPGGGRIQACMKAHFAEYSEPCKRAIITAKFNNL
jgi:Cysteine rich repeat